MSSFGFCDCRPTPMGLRRKPNVAKLLAALGVAITASACLGRSQTPSIPLPPSAAAAGPVATPPPPMGVEMIAEAQGNAVLVTVINHSKKPVRVGPEMLGVIVGRKVYPGDSADVTASFPRRLLGEKQWAAGVLRFDKLGPLEGRKLVLNTPDAPKQFVIIKRYDPQRRIEYRRSYQELSRRERKRLTRERKKRIEEIMRMLRQPSAGPIVP